MKRPLYLPIGIFVALVALLAVGLTRNPREVPSPLVGKPAPAFELPLLREPQKVFSSREPAGQVWVLNVWASWCAPCREEHPFMVQLSKSGLAPLYGLNYKDRREDALKWLGQYGDPYRAAFSDPQGKVGFDYGVYGVPESFVVGRDGTILYKHIGPLGAGSLRDDVMPQIEKALAESNPSR
jgi:cytochrome c biogenesis protein CcmG/thiol:disulfide interchange protein DsbE